MNDAGLGTVYLVGAGPGDPGLLTVRGAELLRQCDCVVHDSLVNPAILALVAEQVDRRDVGKRGGATSTTQSAINELLVELASRYRRIVRLKGGDPFLFGRGGEEAAALSEAGVPFLVVPGVTSGIGVPAYAGIPVTHRAASSVVAFATGHQAKDSTGDLNWASLAHIETVVLYMGMHKLAENCAALIAHGRSADTPAAAIQWGTYARQRVVTGTLRTLPALAKEAKLAAPAITVIGDVVRYREKIRWFDNRPLSGRRVLVTRARDSASELCDLLGATGAEVVEAPLARHVAPQSWDDVDATLLRLSQFDWVAFTSANAVRFLWRRMRELGLDGRAFASVRLAAVGGATARALEACGLQADLVPEHYDAAALGTAMRACGMHCVGNIPPTPALPRVLLPQADNARSQLRDWLVRQGCPTTALVTYRTLSVACALPDGDGTIDAVTFASSATVERFVAALGAAAVKRLIDSGCRFISIGPQTSDTMRSLSIPLAMQAEQASVASLVQATIIACRLAGGQEPG